MFLTTINPNPNAGTKTQGTVTGSGEAVWKTQRMLMSTLTPDYHRHETQHLKVPVQGFHGGAVVKNPPANAGDMGSSPGLGRSYMPRSN